MPTKTKQPTYSEAVFFNFKDLLKTIDFNDIEFVERMEGEKRRDLCKFCHMVYHNEFFKQIIKNFIWTQVMFTADEGISTEQQAGGKLMCQGIKTVEDFFRKYAQIYDSEFAPVPEKFDPKKSFSPQKL